MRNVPFVFSAAFCLVVALLVAYIWRRRGLSVSRGGGGDGKLLSSSWRRRGSSIYCKGGGNDESISTRTCRIDNLCYFAEHDELVILHGEESIFYGLPLGDDGDSSNSNSNSLRFRPLVDLTSVRDHNTQRFEYVDLPAEALDEANDSTLIYHRGLHFLFKRFNPGNLMHVLHDDLLPIYVAMRSEQMEGVSEPFRLVAIDSHPVGPFTQLYDALSSSSLIHKDDLRRDGRIACFEHALIGMTKETTWYQYGFFQRQGPVDNPKANGRIVRQLARHIRRRLHINEDERDDGSSSFVLLSRSINRRIINEDELSDAIEKELGSSLTILPIESTSLRDTIVHVSKASLLMGMHGGTLALALFLRPHSALVELFPYAVPSEEYTPYKTLAQLPDMSIAYEAWENQWIDKTIIYPHNPPLYGGIVHLNETLRERILQSDRVSSHRCCYDPEWLFRAYQDTIVDVPSILATIRRAAAQRDAACAL
ncbi:protein O-linked-mannose beta-1,4-N-acetylglucosaminyltransferase 2-like [Oscarella lobularis]|uniref:protein O-linked-mannose beta-1,4-N-acetylglucosaminyltransferase 2-like n=1 Tax=Oscarella lobularis TaxID=121494 RepID=UPI0033132DF6